MTSALEAGPAETPAEFPVAAAALTRHYGSGSTAVEALRGVDLAVAAQELVAVMGPSGSGKSTLMHLLAGLDTPTSGTVRIAGIDLSALDDGELTRLRRRHIGFIFQFFNLLPMLDAEENVTLPLAIAGERPEQGWVDEVLARVGLGQRRTHRPAQLSGGEQQRVAIARALITRPTVLLADEPTGNLDSRTGGEILELLRRSVDAYAQTTVMVTHDPRAAAIADRILFIADGRIVKELTGATAAEVLGVMGELGGVIAVALKGLAGRKLRTALTAIAIVLGVAMISGTYVLTDTIKAAFGTVFSEIYKRTDVIITSKSAIGEGGEEEGGHEGGKPPAFPESLLTSVRGLPGIAQAQGGVSSTAQLVGRDGKVLGVGGAPGLAFSVRPHGNRRFNPLTLVAGNWPVGPGEIGIDANTADRHRYRVGETIGVIARGPEQRMRIAAIVRIGGVSSLGGATLAIFDFPVAQQLFHLRGQLDLDLDRRRTRREARADPARGAPAATAERGGADRRRAGPPVDEELERLPHDVPGLPARVRRRGVVRRRLRHRQHPLDHDRPANARAGHAAHARRDPSPGAPLGAARGPRHRPARIARGPVPRARARQGTQRAVRVVRDRPAPGVDRLRYRARSSCPCSSASRSRCSRRCAPRSARRACLRSQRFTRARCCLSSRFARFGPYAALATIAAAVALMLIGLFVAGLSTTARLVAIGVGAGGVFVGVAMLAKTLVPQARAGPRVAGYEVRRDAGRLARANAMRNPGRTASTAAALMIGLALVTLVSVLAAGLKSTFESSVNQIFDADYALTATNNFSPISTASAEAVSKVPGVRVAAPVRAGAGRAYGKTITVSGVGPEVSRVIKVRWQSGSPAVPAELGESGAFVSKEYAKSHHLHSGSQLTVETPSGSEMQLRVRGIFAPPKGGAPYGDVTISRALFDSEYQDPQNVYTFVDMAGGANAANTRVLQRALQYYPDAKIQTESEFKRNQEKGIDTLLNLLYVLLSLSIIVSLFGIVNTLVLTVFERTRELGMLRAVGMTRRQLRRMIRQESVVTALIGAALGIPVGIVLALMVGQAIEYPVFTIPVGTLFVFVLAAIAAGLLAAVFPARRAARLNVLEALQYE